MKSVSCPSRTETVVETKVDVVELMGSETYLYLKARPARRGNIVARVDPRSASRTGDTDEGRVRRRTACTSSTRTVS